MTPNGATAVNKDFLNAIFRTWKLTQQDVDNGVTLEQLICSTIEELGEFCRARAVETGQFGKQNKILAEGSWEEGIDIAICGFALGYMASGCLDTEAERACVHNFWVNQPTDTPDDDPLVLLGLIGEIIQRAKRGIPNWNMQFHAFLLAFNALKTSFVNDKDFTITAKLMNRKLDKWETQAASALRAKSSIAG